MSTLLEEPKAPGLRHFLGSSIGDKLMAAVIVGWVTAFSVIAIKRSLGLTLSILFATNAFLNLLVLVRRNPRRVSLNPWFWVLTWAASGHVILYGLFLNEQAPALLPEWFNSGVAIFALAVTAWARITMGLNFGFVPALRKIVTGGPFRFVRHPVYTALCLILIARFTESASVATAVLGLVGIALWSLKALSEEAFLKSDEEYSQYMQKVRWRLLPFVF